MLILLEKEFLWGAPYGVKRNNSISAKVRKKWRKLSLMLEWCCPHVRNPSNLNSKRLHWSRSYSRSRSRCRSISRNACNLNKPEKQTQHSDTVKEELPVCETTGKEMTGIATLLYTVYCRRYNGTTVTLTVTVKTTGQRQKVKVTHCKPSWPRTCVSAA